MTLDHDADHDRIEELLAGYALRSLSDADAAEADRLLAEHVPSCARCRETLHDFIAVEGELGLAAPSVEPPDLLLPRIRQSVADRRVRRRRPAIAWGAAVAAAAVVGLGAWNTVALNGRVDTLKSHEQGITGAFTVLSDPQSKTVPLASHTITSAAPVSTPRMSAAYVPGREEMSIVGTGVPEPSAEVYRVWLQGADGSSTYVGDFLPDDGLVAISFYVDLTGYTALIITEENGPPGAAPSGATRWFTEL